MRLTDSRRQDLSLAAGVGFCLGVYVVLAFAFHWLMQPTVSTNYGLAAYKPPPATVVVYPTTPFVPPDPSELPSSSVAAEPPVLAAFAAVVSEVEKKPAVELPKQAPQKGVKRTSRRHETVRDRRNSGDHQVSHSPYEFRSVW
jgi:hypothetical protein